MIWTQPSGPLCLLRLIKSFQMTILLEWSAWEESSSNFIDGFWFLKPVWPDNNKEEDSEGTNEKEAKHSCGVECAGNAMKYLPQFVLDQMTNKMITSKRCSQALLRGPGCGCFGSSWPTQRSSWWWWEQSKESLALDLPEAKLNRSNDSALKNCSSLDAENSVMC